MWLKLLKEAVDRTSCAQVAKEIAAATGRPISRTTVSLVVNDKYPAKLDKIETLVLDTFGQVVCPFLGESITLAFCRQHHEASAPTSSPRAMRHWRACQGCEFNATKKEAV